jgi:hypothetical protein
MDLRTYFFSLPSATARAEFAARAGTTKLYVHQLICRSPKSRRKASSDLARKLSEESGGAVGLHELRPDIWNPPNES